MHKSTTGSKKEKEKKEIHSTELKDSPFRVFQGTCVYLVDRTFWNVNFKINQ